MTTSSNSSQTAAKPQRKPRGSRSSATPSTSRGNLRIGDDWNAITIIALSQASPLKAIAEFVENSIDAKATQITIVRGKEAGSHYLRIIDNGQGIPLDAEGKPDFKYVATHVCDSVKKRLKSQGSVQGIQGEFGIGLLSFWTVGEELTIRSSGSDGRTYQMTLRKGEPKYVAGSARTLLSERGTELIIRPLLPGLRSLSGEKLQWYLASELRNRILASGVDIRIVDRTARAEFRVEPRRFTGRRIAPQDPMTTLAGLIQLELYLDEPKAESKVSLFRHGTRVLESVSELEELNKEPWTSGYIQGFVDAPFLNLTPGTRLGVIRDEAYATFVAAMSEVAAKVLDEIGEQQRAEEERASRNTLTSLQRAFKEALRELPVEEYDWFDIRERTAERAAGSGSPGDNEIEASDLGSSEALAEGRGPQQRAFFEFPGPLFSARISPGSSLLPVASKRSFRSVARDKKGCEIHDGLTVGWEVVEGGGALSTTEGEIIEFTAPEEPGLVRLKAQVKQGDMTCEAFATITITDTLMPRRQESGERPAKGLPGYTFRKAPGELWRSRYDEAHHLVVVNNGHADFVYASRNKTLKLRYLCRLFGKELVRINFPGLSGDELLEKLIELTLRAEEFLR